MINRRDFINATAGGIWTGVALPQFSRADDKRSGVTFSFGTYGMKAMKTEDAIRTITNVGYDGLEMTVTPDRDCSPAKVPPARRHAMRNLIDDSGLELTALMEHLYPDANDHKHKAGLDRLISVAELGYELHPSRRPLIQTVLGGGKWEEQKSLFVDRLGDWAELAEKAETVIAIKPHRGGAMSRPTEAAWLIQQLGNTKWLRMVYDYSHYAFRKMPVEETVKTALPFATHVAIKDTIKTEKGFRFVLPGSSGMFDYAELFQLLYQGGYRGDICCEVSGMVWSQTGYDPVAAANACYQKIAPIFEAAAVPRRRG